MDLSGIDEAKRLLQTGVTMEDYESLQKQNLELMRMLDE
jgi:hypothetical protein